MLRGLVIVVAAVYVLGAMGNGTIYLVQNWGGGWPLDALVSGAVEHAFFWPVHLFQA